MLIRILKTVASACLVALGIFLTVWAYQSHNQAVYDIKEAERSADLKVIFDKFIECKKGLGYAPTDPCDGWRDAYFALQMDQQTRDARMQLEKMYRRYPHLRPVTEPVD